MPEETQYGLDTTITCDWGFNRNAKIVTFYRSPVQLPKEQLAKFEFDSNGELIGDGEIGDRKKYRKVLGTKNNISLSIHDVSQDAGNYWCTVALNITAAEKMSEQKELVITRRYNQNIGKNQ